VTTWDSIVYWNLVYHFFTIINADWNLQKRYYLATFIGEMNLFEILELVIINNTIFKIYVLVKQIKVENFNLHFELFEVNQV